MAIAVDAAQGRTNGSGTSVSLTCGTVGAGSDRILIVAVASEADNTTLSSVAYDGQSMTQLGTYFDLTDGAREMSLWYVVAPNSGTGKTVTATQSASTPWQIGATAYTGVDQSTPFTATTTCGPDASSPVTLALTSDADGSWAVGFLQGSNSSFNLDSGGAERQKVIGAVAEGAYIVDSNADIASASSNTFSASYSGTGGGLGAMMRPVAAATSVKDLLGVGLIPFAR
jgi:hypothetical protein